MISRHATIYQRYYLVFAWSIQESDRGVVVAFTEAFI